MLVGRNLPYPEEAKSMGKVYILETRIIVTSIFRAFLHGIYSMVP